jgi:uncharacterized protein
MRPTTWYCARAQSRLGTWFGIAVAFALALNALPAIAMPDCSRPRSSIDRLVCTSDKLSVADQLMARAFRDAYYRTEDKEALLQDQERWQQTVRDACNDVPCLLRAYQDRTSELETW